MKYIVVSDIHGSYLFFNKVIEYFNEHSCDKILLLGDILYHGPRNDLPAGHDVKKLINLLNEYKDRIIAVRGNCDAEVDEMVLDFKIHDNYEICINNLNFFMTHGHHINPNSPLKNKENFVILYGHSHIPDFCKIENNYYFNPGSIAIPKGGSVHSFGLIENNTISLIDIKGNVLIKYEV